MIGDKKFRFIETHVESMDEAVQVAQGRELIAALADTTLPIVMVGDFNSNAHQQPHIRDYTATYPEIVAAGFQDAWAAVNRDHLGNTCCHAADLPKSRRGTQPASRSNLHPGAITPISAKLVGAEPAARTPSGLWPTDHAGVLATLRFQ